jgi:hypothetical protein
MLLLLLVIPLSIQEVVAQSSEVYRQDNDLATKQFESVVLEGQMFELFSKLALHLDVPIGLEIGSESHDLSLYRIELTNGTLPELLDQIIKQNPKYDWLFEKGVVNVFPRVESRDLFIGEILSVRVKRFTIKKGTVGLDVQDLLFTSPEIKAIMDRNGIEPAGTNFSGFSFPQLGREFSLNVSNRTTKEILNQIVKKSPLARIWIVSRDISARTLRLTVNSRHESMAPKD